VIFLASPATAAGCWEDLATTTAEMTVTGKFEATMSCMAELAAKVEQLEATQPVPSMGKHEKTRAVVAFYADKGQQACPDEWSLYVEAKDRMIVGAGALYQYPGETGGEEQVTLTETQMPSHKHSFSGTEVITGGWGEQAVRPVAVGGTQASGRYTPQGAISQTGGGKSHPNMPPYIALYFCKKD